MKIVEDLKIPFFATFVILGVDEVDLLYLLFSGKKLDFVAFATLSYPGHISNLEKLNVTSQIVICSVVVVYS